jgi:hypothetical protein
MTKRSVVVGLLLLIAPSLCAAQSSGAKQQPTPTRAEGGDKTKTATLPPGRPPVLQAQQVAVDAAALPSGKDAWVVQVVIGGGFTGAGKGSVTVSSDGSVTCSPNVTPPAACDGGLTPELLKSLAESVREAKPEKWRDFGQGGCFDCYATTLALRRRGKGGAVQVFYAYWDDVNAGALPADVRRIYENAMKVAPAYFLPI